MRARSILFAGALVAIVGAGTSPAPAATTITKPFDRTSISAVCGLAPAERCTVEVSADHRGAVAVAVDPTTPGGGMLPGVTHERGFASVWATPAIGPADAVAVIATVLVHEARATGDGILTGGANARAAVFLDVRHDGCACISRVERTIVVAGGPDVLARSVTISTILAMPTGMPAGSLRLEAGVRASASVTDAGVIPQPGSSTAAISATVGSIAFAT